MASSPPRFATTPRELPLRTLEGVWQVVATNFPMWLKGDKTQPSFEYVRLDERRLDDTVSYLARGKRGVVRGIDTQHAEVPSHFTWRGRGWLSLFKSEWDVVALDDSRQWAVIYFAKTLVTPEGVDVIARDRSHASEAVARAQRLIDADPFLRSKAAGLRVL